MKITARQNELLVEHRYSKTHHIKKMFGTDVDLRNLEPNQSVCMGDGKTYYWLLTEKEYEIKKV
jgi:hypothetical protein